jgi:polysaccharide export outer membrane protein
MRWRAEIVCFLAGVALTAGFGPFFSVFGAENGRPRATHVDVGDLVQVTVFETPEGASPGNSVTLPSQTVGCAGTLSVPYAGDIRAAGRTTFEIAREIEGKLATRAIDPRIVVTLVAKSAAGAVHCPI